MIKIIGLNKNYDFAVLQDINLELPDKGFVALIGESGSGKSTLLKCIGLLEKPSSGEIWYGNKKLTSLNTFAKENMRGKIFAYISQSTALIEDETVDNGLSFFCSDAQKRLEVLKKLGIEDKKDELARNLSGGERQRVAIAQALLRDTPVLLCDEITANLDPKNAEEVHKILKEISHERLVLCVGHNPKTLANYADRMITLEEGEVCEDKCFAEDIHVDDKECTIQSKKTSIGVKKFFKIFSWGIKAKLARIIFCTIFLFVALTGFCFGTTQAISGSDSLIRKQAELLGVEFVKVQERQEDSFFAIKSDHWQMCTVFVDFEKEKEHFELIEGKLPTKENEILISEFEAVNSKLKVGSEIFLTGKEGFVVSGIFKSDMSAYKFSRKIPEDYYPYPSITAWYLSIGSLSFYEKNGLMGAVNNNGINILNYNDEPVIAGRPIDENATAREVLASTGYMCFCFDCEIEDIMSNLQGYFNKLQKDIKLNGYDFTIVGIYDNEYAIGLEKIGPKLYLDSSVGYYVPIEEVKKDNFYHDKLNTTFITTAMQRHDLNIKIGMPVFGVFALLAIILLVNLNLFETDEKKILFRNMRQAGFNKHSLIAYNLFVNFFILAIALVLFMAISLPIMYHCQIIDLEFDSMYLYVLSGWAVVCSVLVMTAIIILSYFITYAKFNKEISICSKS